MIDEKFIILAVIIDIIGSLGYAADTLKGKTKPNRVTWFLWTVIPLVALIGMIDEQASMTTMILTFVFSLMPLIIFVASFVNEKSYWKITKFDLICGGLSFMGIAALVITGSGNLTIVFSMIANFLAWLPTLIKAFKAPETETWLAYSNGALASVITLFTVKEWTFASVGLLIYFIFSCSITFTLVKFKLGPKIMAVVI